MSTREHICKQNIHIAVYQFVSNIQNTPYLQFTQTAVSFIDATRVCASTA